MSVARGLIMADHKEIIAQLSALLEELGRVVEVEQSASNTEARKEVEELSNELDTVRAQAEDATQAKQNLELELDVFEKRNETLVQKLKDARQAAADAVEESQKTLRRQFEALQEECDELRNDLEKERSLRKRLEKGANADEKRLEELEKALAEASPAQKHAIDSKDVARLQEKLDKALDKAREEQEDREALEEELAEAHKLIEALEKAVKKSRSADENAAKADLQALTEKLEEAESRAAQAQAEAERLATAVEGAERRIAELESSLKSAVGKGKSESVAEDEEPLAKATSDKPLPHELRPAPKKGAIFHPDWDLEGLPCGSAEQVLQAWESSFNVQLSLEGYPAQYCTAFLVVLKVGKQKRVFILFRLKKDKHTLICVPASPPTDEAALKKMVQEGLKYLQMSGFEIVEMATENFASSLGSYFLEK